MTLLVIAFMGVAGGYFSIWSAVMFNDSVEKRAVSLLIGTLVDVILLAGFMLMGNGIAFSWFLMFKYAFLSIVNFDETLRQ